MWKWDHSIVSIASGTSQFYGTVQWRQCMRDFSTHWYSFFSLIIALVNLIWWYRNTVSWPFQIQATPCQVTLWIKSRFFLVVSFFTSTTDRHPVTCLYMITDSINMALDKPNLVRFSLPFLIYLLCIVSFLDFGSCILGGSQKPDVTSSISADQRSLSDGKDVSALVYLKGVFLSTLKALLPLKH